MLPSSNDRRKRNIRWDMHEHMDMIRHDEEEVEEPASRSLVEPRRLQQDIHLVQKRSPFSFGGNNGNEIHRIANRNGQRSPMVKRSSNRIRREFVIHMSIVSNPCAKSYQANVPIKSNHGITNDNTTYPALEYRAVRAERGPYHPIGAPVGTALRAVRNAPTTHFTLNHRCLPTESPTPAPTHGPNSHRLSALRQFSPPRHAAAQPCGPRHKCA